MYEKIADKIAKSVVGILKKEALLDMAKNGNRRPKGRHPFRALRKYIRSDSDREFFEKEIRPIAPHWFEKTKPPVSYETVIQRLLNAHKGPAYKANATRSLRAYAENRAKEIGSTPERIAAGVKAAATKRMNKLKPSISVAPETNSDIKSA